MQLWSDLYGNNWNQERDTYWKKLKSRDVQIANPGRHIWTNLWSIKPNSNFRRWTIIIGSMFLHGMFHILCLSRIILFYRSWKRLTALTLIPMMLQNVKTDLLLWKVYTSLLIVLLWQITDASYTVLFHVINRCSYPLLLPGLCRFQSFLMVFVCFHEIC